MEKIRKDRNLISVYFIFSIAFFSLLCLGMWQLSKHYSKSYKKNLVDIKLKKEPKDLNNLTSNIEDNEIVKIKGEFLENKSLFFEPRTHKGKVGFHKLIPIRVKEKYFLVNRGFTLEKDELIKNKNITINGLIINFPKPKFFELKNDIQNNQWYSLNIEDISTYLNIKLEPFLIYEINNTNNKIINVKPNYLSEINHLNYAITWFMLAITLSLIFIFFTRKISNV